VNTKTVLPLLLLAGLGIFPLPSQAAQSATSHGLGLVYQLSPDSPKYVTCDIEFRDPTEAKWPNIFYGKPAAHGHIKYDLVQPAASFVVRCDRMAQRNGDQSRRALGELCVPGTNPMVTISINFLGPLQPGSADGKSKDKATTHATWLGVLDVDGRKVPIKAPVTFKYHEGKGDEKSLCLMVESRFEVKREELGIKAAGPNEIVQVRVGLTAFLPTSAKPDKP